MYAVTGLYATLNSTYFTLLYAICVWIFSPTLGEINDKRINIGYPDLFRFTFFLGNSAFHPSEVGKSSTGLLAGVKAGRVHLCRVAGNTV